MRHGRIINSSLLTTTYPSYDTFSRLSSLAVSNQTERLWSADYAYDVDRLASVTVTSPSAPYSLLKNEKGSYLDIRQIAVAGWDAVW